MNTLKRPTIGIEIEIPWATILARKSKRAGKHYLATAQCTARFSDAEHVFETKREVQKEYGPLLSRLGNRGLRATPEEFCLTELVSNPQNDIDITAQDVASLYYDGLLKQPERYPLHVTVGELSAVQDASGLLRSMEIMGDTSPARLAEKQTWDIKGNWGVKQRAKEQMLLNCSRGVEFRTPELTSPEQLHTVLRTAQLGGYGILAANHNFDTYRIWQSWRNTLNDQFVSKGISPHSTSRNAWPEYINALQDASWIGSSKEIIAEHIELLDTAST